jgi:hypothetical protein
MATRNGSSISKELACHKGDAKQGPDGARAKAKVSRHYVPLEITQSFRIARQDHFQIPLTSEIKQGFFCFCFLLPSSIRRAHP